jgi:uncharacterized protein YndB with AHSA1/START domain
MAIATAVKRVAVKKRVVAKAGPARALPVSDAAILNATGCTWSKWISALDYAGARSMPHGEIAKLIGKKFKTSSWWSQMITVGYERARGKRIVHQRTSGFSVSVSRTVGAPVAALYGAWKEPRRRALWLPRTPLTIRTSSANKRLRVTWRDRASDVLVSFTPRGATKSTVEVEHSKLADAKSAANMKRYWGAALDRMKKRLEG